MYLVTQDSALILSKMVYLCLNCVCKIVDRKDLIILEMRALRKQSFWTYTVHYGSH